MNKFIHAINLQRPRHREENRLANAGLPSPMLNGTFISGHLYLLLFPSTSTLASLDNQKKRCAFVAFKSPLICKIWTFSCFLIRRLQNRSPVSEQGGYQLNCSSSWVVRLCNCWQSFPSRIPFVRSLHCRNPKRLLIRMRFYETILAPLSRRSSNCYRGKLPVRENISRKELRFTLVTQRSSPLFSLSSLRYSSIFIDIISLHMLTGRSESNFLLLCTEIIFIRVIGHFICLFFYTLSVWLYCSRGPWCSVYRYNEQRLVWNTHLIKIIQFDLCEVLTALNLRNSVKQTIPIWICFKEQFGGNKRFQREASPEYS